MSTTDTPAEQQALPGDGLREGILDELRRRIGDALVQHELRPNDDLWVRVATDAWAATGEAVRAMGFTYFCYLSGMDWLPSPYGRGEENPDEPAPERSTEIVQGVAGGETRFQVFARVVDTARHVGVTLKTDVADESPAVATWSSIYAGANWHEREAHEMFGIDFVGHPDLRHMYLPGEFEGHPLRKDFPLLARMVKPWPGIVDVEPMPAEDLDGDGVADPAPTDTPSAAGADAADVDPTPAAVDTATPDAPGDEAAGPTPDAATADEAAGTNEVPVGEVSSQAGTVAGPDAATEAAETSPDEAPAPQSTEEAEASAPAGGEDASIDETDHVSATTAVDAGEAGAAPAASEPAEDASPDAPDDDGGNADAEGGTAAGEPDADADAGGDREVGADEPPTEDAGVDEPGGAWSPDIPVADVEGPYGLGSKSPRPDGAQPPDHPIKADPSTRRFFVPGSEGYDDLEPGVWFDSETTARQAGFVSPFEEAGPFDSASDLGGQGAASGTEATQIDDRHDSRPDGPAQEGGEA